MYFSVLFIGGVRGAGFIHSPLLENPGGVSKDLIHVTDWLPTILSLAGVKIPENILDGMISGILYRMKKFLQGRKFCLISMIKHFVMLL